MTSLRHSNKRDAAKVAGKGRPRATMLRSCPRCGAGPNQSCTETRGARVAGQDTGGGYTVRLKMPHRERAAQTSSTDTDTADITAGRHGGNPESAAANDSISPDKARLRRLVLTFIRHRGLVGATSDEVEISLRLSHQTVSARISELKASGELRDTGRRRPTRSGRGAAVLIAVDPDDEWEAVA